MIKECNVILQNKEVMVIEFDKTQVQLSNSNGIKDKSVYVEFKDGKYTLSNKEEYEKSKFTPKKITKKLEVESDNSFAIEKVNSDE